MTQGCQPRLGSFEVEETLSAYELEDPLLTRFEMPLEASYYPFGFPVEIATNSEDVLAAAEEQWGMFRKIFSVPPVRLRIGVLGGPPELELTEPVRRSQGHLLTIIGSCSDFAVCDFKQGFAFAWVAASTARNHSYLHTQYIDGTLFCLLHSLYMAPIHAACVALKGKGLLLCGDAEAGKSSLAYACARKGWTFITDDLSDIVRHWETATVVGNPYRIRLREPAVSTFPELRDHPITLRANGERAIEIATAQFPNLLTAPYSPVDYMLFLRRQSSGGASLKPYSKEEAWAWLAQVLCLGEEETRQAQAVALRRLLSLEILEFRYSDLDSAVEKLANLVSSVLPPVPPRELLVGCRQNG